MVLSRALKRWTLSTQVRGLYLTRNDRLRCLLVVEHRNMHHSAWDIHIEGSFGSE